MDEANQAAALSMMEQEKFMQEMLFAAASGFPGANPFNPFGFPAVPPPPVPSTSSSSNSKSHKLHRGGRERSQSPSSNANGGLDRSISPASSVASNISQQPASAADFNVFMNNLMSFGGGGGGGGAAAFTPPLPMPPLLPGMAGDLSKLPVELLAALTAAAGQGGLDPTMFSALAQLNSLSNSVANSEENRLG